jgi:phosphoserine phosphatase RsbU/P
MDQTPLPHSILDVFDEGLCLLGKDGRVLFINEAAVRLTGRQREELIGRPFCAYLNLSESDGAGPLCSDTDGAAQSHRAPLWKPAKLAQKGGGILDVLCMQRLVEQDNAERTLLQIRKTELGSAPECAVADIKSKLEAIFDAMSDGLVVITEVGDIELFSSSAEKLFGYQRDEVLGQNVKVLMPSPDQEADDNYLAAYRESGVKKIIGVGREVSGRRKDGAVFPMYLSIGELLLEGRRFFVALAHDLTKLKRAERQFETFFSAVDQSPAAILISDTEGRIEYVNRRFLHLTGYHVDEVIGQNPRLLRSVSTSEDQHRVLWETLNAGREWRGEIEDRTKSGELYWALETITPMRDAHGAVAHYLAIQTDITEQKRDKEALAESEERFRQMAEMAGEWLWEQDAQGRYVYSSGAVRSILGLAPEEILGKSYLDLLIENDREYWIRPSSQGAVSCRPFHRVVNHYRHKDGQEVFTESTGAPILDEKGRLLKWRGVDHDITARKAFEDALRVRDRAIESVHVGIVISDAQAPGNPNVYVNPALSQITGYTREELIGGNMRLLQGPETDRATVQEIRQALEKGQRCEVTLKNYRKDGLIFWNELLISPVFDEKGKVTHYIGVQTDVTERRKAEESRRELEIAKQIQLSLLPQAPLRVARAHVAGTCVPASQVGGDYFDFFENSGDIDLVIADVSGHSVGAALVMTEVRSTLRAEALKKSTARVGPAQVLCGLNALLWDDLNKAELFMTMFYMKFRPDLRALSYASAGHNYPLLLRSTDSFCLPLDANGLVIGVLPNVDFEECSVELFIGDKVLLYTDGIIEAENEEGDFFGLDRLSALLTLHRDESPEELVRRLLQEVRTFCGDAQLRDDVAMMLMQVY